ncbi:MAG: hypothetical protein U9Q06_01190 [Nanoarchaeota archaeon]|nr:hypothetical protein [Nanoarchaeota archaeon]
MNKYGLTQRLAQIFSEEDSKLARDILLFLKSQSQMPRHSKGYKGVTYGQLEKKVSYRTEEKEQFNRVFEQLTYRGYINSKNSRYFSISNMSLNAFGERRKRRIIH